MKSWRLRLLLVAAVACAAAYAVGENPSALWQIVHDQCVVHTRQGKGPAPCASVEMHQGTAKGYAILKDLRGASQFLFVPTERLAGIESPELLAPGATNYFAEAWRARQLVSEQRGRQISRRTLSLAINSSEDRTQDQLHIHLDCVRADVRQRLQELGPDGATEWRSVTLPGWRNSRREYRVKRVAGEELGVDPFQLVAREIPGARADMREHSIAVVGTADPSGFFILDTQGDRAHAEDLQDHSECPAE